VAIHNLQPGSKIILNEGVFKGQSAIVKELRGQKVQLVLEALGVLVTMEGMDD
jgi:transcription antitermination factor NusG